MRLGKGENTRFTGALPQDAPQKVKVQNKGWPGPDTIPWKVDQLNLDI
jgi:hypothetical protein